MFLSSDVVVPVFSVPSMDEASENSKAVFEKGSNRFVLDGYAVPFEMSVNNTYLLEPLRRVPYEE